MKCDKGQVVEAYYRDNERIDVGYFLLSEKEKQRQLVKWGIQAHTLSQWNAILGEEVGEVSKAVLEHIYAGKSENDIIEELVQVATVALNMATAIKDSVTYVEEQKGQRTE